MMALLPGCVVSSKDMARRLCTRTYVYINATSPGSSRRLLHINSTDHNVRKLYTISWKLPLCASFTLREKNCVYVEGVGCAVSCSSAWARGVKGLYVVKVTQKLHLFDYLIIFILHQSQF